MATLQFGAIVTAARGSIGGTTFSKGGPVQVAKNKGRPGRPMLASQQYSKQQMAKFATMWRDLNSSDRDDWATYAASASFTNSLGQTYYLTGFQMYVRNSLALAQRGTVQTASVPTAMGKSTLPDLTFDYDSGNIRLTAVTPTLPSGAEIRGAIYAPAAQSRNAPRGRLWGTWYFTTESLPFLVATSYSAGLASGYSFRAWIVLRYIDETGRVGDEFFYPVDFTV